MPPDPTNDVPREPAVETVFPDDPRTARVSIVLVEPRSPGNVGAVARAIKNTGFRDLRLVNPCAIDGEARRMACASEDILDRARRYERLEQAVADARLVVAFTARDRRDLRPTVDLDHAVSHVRTALAHGPVALVYGREDRGLETSELEPCQILARIPAASDRLVYNLSQAVLLSLFGLRAGLARESARRARNAEPAERLSRLDGRARGHLLERVSALLSLLEYDTHPDPGLKGRILHRLRVLIDRAALDASDHAMLLGVIRRIEERLGHARDSR